jgi:hypothetical protein
MEYTSVVDRHVVKRKLPEFFRRQPVRETKFGFLNVGIGMDVDFGSVVYYDLF